MYFRRKTSAGRAYLQIVESRREAHQVRQLAIATLGRFEDLQASGQLERLVRSGARFAAKAMMLSAAADDAAIKIAVRRIGPALVFERLWEETGCRARIADLAGARGHKFALERAVFLTVLHRLFVSVSDQLRIAGVKTTRSPASRGSICTNLPGDGMAGRGAAGERSNETSCTPFSPRCLKDVVEERVFGASARTCSHGSTWCSWIRPASTSSGAGGPTLGQGNGYSKDHRPDLRQMILAVLLDGGDGRPVCSEMCGRAIPPT